MKLDVFYQLVVWLNGIGRHVGQGQIIQISIDSGIQIASVIWKKNIFRHKSFERVFSVIKNKFLSNSTIRKLKRYALQYYDHDGLMTSYKKQLSENWCLP